MAGPRVGKVNDLAIQVMVANGKAPEVISWGTRVFVLDGDDGQTVTYREGLMWSAINIELG
jgi:hypothetical protein